MARLIGTAGVNVHPDSKRNTLSTDARLLEDEHTLEQIRALIIQGTKDGRNRWLQCEFVKERIQFVQVMPNLVDSLLLGNAKFSRHGIQSIFLQKVVNFVAAIQEVRVSSVGLVIGAEFRSRMIVQRELGEKVMRTRLHLLGQLQREEIGQNQAPFREELLRRDRSEDEIRVGVW